jgi:hypothetical protein
MIHFLSTRRNSHPLRWYLATYGARLRGRLVPHAYEDAVALAAPPPGTWIFGDVEVLSEGERARAEALHRRIEAAGGRCLNHPTRSLRRFDLLKALHRSGRNDFDVHRPGDVVPAARFPVFVRRENDHEGGRSDRLATPAALEETLAAMRRAGEPLSDTMVVEFADVADRDGVVRKYGAFRVGDRILARHVFFARDWQVKDWDLYDARFAAEERRYVAENPHAAELMETFRLAGIEYGRIDYSVRLGRIQTWEINSNPVIAGTGRGGRVVRAFTRLPRVPRSLAAPLVSPGLPRARVHARFAAALESAWRDLEARAGSLEASRSA